MISLCKYGIMHTVFKNNYNKGARKEMAKKIDTKKSTKKKVDKITEAYHEIMDMYACEVETNLKHFISTLIPFVLTIVGSLEEKKQGKKISKKHRECMKMAKEMLVESLSGAIVTGSTMNMFSLPVALKSVWAERIAYDPTGYIQSILKKDKKSKNKKKSASPKKGKAK